jgi:hypothetical protein
MDPLLSMFARPPPPVPSPFVSQAAREVAETLAVARNVTYLPSSGSNMLLQLRAGGGGGGGAH